MYIHVDRTAQTPLYRQIEDTLRGLIERGALTPGTKLPSTRDLATRVGVNRLTVHKAFQRLEAGGFIVTRIGDGTYVPVRPASTARHSGGVRDPHEDAALRVWGPLFVNPRPATRSLPSMAFAKGPGTASFVYAA